MNNGPGEGGRASFSFNAGKKQSGTKDVLSRNISYHKNWILSLGAGVTSYIYKIKAMLTSGYGQDRKRSGPEQQQMANKLLKYSNSSDRRTERCILGPRVWSKCGSAFLMHIRTNHCLLTSYRSHSLGNNHIILPTPPDPILACFVTTLENK